jgi:hypothetical protein
MSPFWEAFLWSAISVVLVIPVIAVLTYWLTHRRPSAEEDPAERAYWEAKDQAAKAVTASQPERPAEHAYADTGQPAGHPR